jgi:hypothetical protein
MSAAERMAATGSAAGRVNAITPKDSGRCVTMLAVGQPWRRWSGRQIVLFIVETAALSGAIMLLAGGDELPHFIHAAGLVVGCIILMIGAWVVIGWLAQRRRSTQPR